MALKRSERLMIIITISFSFFAAEISVGFYTRSLALVADAFHYLSDLIGFIVALVALKISERPNSPSSLSFGWQRSNLLGAFFNGVFLLGLGVSIFLQAIERFVSLQKVENPKLVLIIGCVGLTLNIISASFLHEHNHDGGHEQGHGSGTTENDENVRLDGSMRAPTAHRDHRHTNTMIVNKKGRDLGVMGVLIHLIGDAINNVGVIIAALVIWLTSYEGRFYADPGVSVGIAILILATAIPLVKNSGSILLESVPLGINLADVQHDLKLVPGIVSVHELHVWRLNQNKALASAHVVTVDSSLQNFMTQAQRIGECLHAYGIHSVTLQPELGSMIGEATGVDHSINGQELRLRREADPACQIVCGTICEPLTCCG